MTQLERRRESQVSRDTWLGYVAIAYDVGLPLKLGWMLMLFILPVIVLSLKLL